MSRSAFLDKLSTNGLSDAGMNVIPPEDAELMLKKWRDERTVVYFETELFAPWGMGLRGIVESVADDGLVLLVSTERDATASFRVGEIEGFEYGEDSKFRSGVLVALLPLRRGESARKRDKLFIGELV